MLNPLKKSIFAPALSCLLLLSLAGPGFGSEDSGPSLDAKAFQDPPISARPGAFWNWLNGNTDRDRIREDLRQMKEKGMSGAEIWDVAAVHNGTSIPAGPEFLSPESARTIRFALAEARKLGLRMGMITSSGWNAGGTWVDPGWASKVLISSAVEVSGPSVFDGALPFPPLPKECPTRADGKPVYFREVATLAVPASPDKSLPDADSVVDLTDQLASDGMLRWEVPEGKWAILRFICTNTGQILIVPSPNSKGLFIDFLDPEATRRHLQVIMDRLEITPAEAAESGLAYLEVDSMELHEGNPWTDKFPEWFVHYRGYDPVRLLPVLAGWTVADKDTSERFLYDYRKTVSDLLIHSHYETGSRFLEKYGMEFVGEAGGPGPPIWNTCPVDALKALGNVHVPRGEFWIQHRNMFLIKEISSAAHIYGKPIVDAEAFTTWRRWEDSPFVLKLSADRAFVEGLNRLTIHGFAHSPKGDGLPGRTYHAGIDINPNTTWWPFARPFMEYLARCSYALQQGRSVADVLWYYGDKAPNFFPEFHDVPEIPRLPGLSHGYDYDVVNSDVILHRLRVENGRFVTPENNSYAVLAFPDDVSMPLEVLQKLESLVRDGGVILGTPPSQVPGLLNHKEKSEQLRKLAARIWGEEMTTGSRPHGKGKAYRGMKLDAVLEAEGIRPDFQVAPAGTAADIHFVHRTAGDSEIYFVRNSATRPATVSANFRVGGKTPELWDPSTGQITQCNAYTADSTSATVELGLDPGGATFVVFNSEPRQTAAPPVVELVHPISPASSWTLSFPTGWGAPTSTTVAALQWWTEFEEPGIRYFSGIAEYRTELIVPREWATTSTPVLLGLGDVNDVAEVEVNGRKAGIAWKPPHRVDVSQLLKEGRNQLVVRVANQWHNRRVGDSLAPESERYTRSNQPLPKKGEAHPLPSGLMGPLTLIASPPCSIKRWP